MKEFESLVGLVFNVLRTMVEAGCAEVGGTLSTFNAHAHEVLFPDGQSGFHSELAVFAHCCP